MITAIFLILLSINFNIASANPKGSPQSARSLNNMAVYMQWLSIIMALSAAIYDALT